MLVRGDIDAITGFTFTSLLNLEARGVKAADVVVMPFADNGVKLYGNAIIASAKLVRENPEAVRAFLKAFSKGAKEVMANPGAAIAYVKERDGIVNTALETRRLQLAIDTVINTADARGEGLWPGQPHTHGADGFPDLGRLCDQDTREPRDALERPLSAARSGTRRFSQEVIAH